MKQFQLAPLAEEDLNQIADYIGSDNLHRAKTFIQELQAKAHTAAERPLSFRARPDIGPDVRSIPHGRYLILFRDLADGIVVLRFFHTAQDLRKIRLD